MDNYIGKKLDGRYEVLALIGEGGMSNVYKGNDLLEDKVVAIKILKEEFHDNEELVRRFKNESRAISVLNQQNIVKVFDVNVDDSLEYIVMEYIDGITLKEYIEQRGEPLTYKESVLFVSQVLRALQHAHDKGIVHRDIKPQNIMLTEDGTVKVMDFGIARLARSDIHTDGEQAIGSVHYISPEQAQGASTDHRADIYSTGIMLYEMLSGTLPFESDNAVSIAIKQISDEAEPLLQRNPSVPAGLGDITMKAMAKDPKHRYQTALEMLRDIEEFKRNPSVKFEYDYLTQDDPARYIGKVANNGKNQTAKGKNGKAAAGAGAKGKKKKKKKRGLLVPITAGLTAAVLLVCGILCYNIFQNSANPLFVDLAEIELPNLVGMTTDEAEAMLARTPYNNLRVMEYTYEYNDGMAKDEIISQNPASDGSLTVKENQRIYLTVNRGVELVEIPNVTGMSRSEVRELLIGLGVRPYIISEVNASVPVGQVFATEPAIGSMVENTTDTVVKVYVSSNATNYSRTVPDLVGLDQDAARLQLEQNDLSLGIVQEAHSDQPEGTVIEQFPEAGVTRSKGTTVSIVISQGPEPEPEPEQETVDVPDFKGWSWGSASSWAGENNIVLVPSYEYSNEPDGTILSGGGGTEDKHSVVNVTVSKGPKPAESSSQAPSSSSPPPESSSQPEESSSQPEEPSSQPDEGGGGEGG